MSRPLEQFDHIIVGQGLAGTALAWRLRRRGLRVLVVDRDARDGASHVAAGLVTPVTGKRLAKSWRWSELIPAARDFYRSVERDTGTALFHERPALRLFASEAERAEYHRRRERLGELVRDATSAPDCFDAPFGGVEMPHAARLDVPAYLDASREQFRNGDGFLAADLDPTHEVEVRADGMRLPRFGVEARGLVFCRGFAASDPWFGRVRFNAAKGEILTLRIPDLKEERVVHRGVWLAPAGGDLFRCGATYAWADLTNTPTPAGRAEIESRLRAFLRVPFEVLDHSAAVRPVIDAGYPVLGRHPEHPQLAYFNGLGSKGSLLAPFFAEQLAACLIGDREIEPALGVRRFFAL
ncbi:NAD(P)/FAD-dependent oxidoreductase [Gemmata sp.]|uniref:NAD(P)/FAD-dependent oxidoreductase n=1 Tax=Gemmata sp. TaxID=1914242 RepID=UPI003F7281F9